MARLFTVEVLVFGFVLSLSSSRLTLLGKHDRNGLLLVLDWLATSAALQRSGLPLVHHLIPRHDSASVEILILADAGKLSVDLGPHLGLKNWRAICAHATESVARMARVFNWIGAIWSGKLLAGDPVPGC